ncbi:hypothetical protein [Bordetella genomosp. 9]|uniref:hypothetical protein n=1 Tax=Bordetella genomosp. 9 TaxID=1416803 RepID=UPI0018DFB6BA|nr:hypothetical protein [Bordetella genomosp. 9]
MSSLSPPRPPHVERLTEFEALVAAGPNALNAIPGAIYLCDKEGKLVCYNREAMRLWGRAPVIGDGGELYCGSYRLYRPDGTFLPHDQCPMGDGRAGRCGHAECGSRHRADGRDQAHGAGEYPSLV